MGKTLSIETLINLVESERISVEWHTGGPKGKWIPARNVISVRYNLSDTQTLCTLAHEFGHAHYGHPAGHDDRYEDAAWRFAARLLISPAEYALAEQMYESQHGVVASELGVTQHLVETWRRMWEHKRAAA